MPPFDLRCFRGIPKAHFENPSWIDPPVCGWTICFGTLLWRVSGPRSNTATCSASRGQSRAQCPSFHAPVAHKGGLSRCRHGLIQLKLGNQTPAPRLSVSQNGGLLEWFVSFWFAWNYQPEGAHHFEKLAKEEWPQDSRKAPNGAGLSGEQSKS